MEQEKLLLQLQELLQVEQSLKKKQELKPLVDFLKKLQDTIKQAETQSAALQKQAVEAEHKALELEKQVNMLNKKIKEGKDKLYGAKGGPLKELLSLQQSVLKMESEVEKCETLYWETVKQIEELKQQRIEVRENIKAMKADYNENLRVYKEKVQQLEVALSENQLKKEEIIKKLSPEILRLFSETEKRFPGNPIAVLRDGACSGCHIATPSVLAVRIREGKTLHRCESCGRILISQG